MKNGKAKNERKQNEKRINPTEKIKFVVFVRCSSPKSTARFVATVVRHRRLVGETIQKRNKMITPAKSEDEYALNYT